MKRDTLKSIAAGLLLLCVPFAAVAFDSSALPGPGPAPAFTAVGGTVTQPVVFTGDNASGTGTLRIRPIDEDTQVVLCEASNNAATEVCSVLQHQNASATNSVAFYGSNTYTDSAGAFQRYNTGFGASTFRASSSSTNTSNFAAMNVYSTNGTHSGDVSLVVSGAGTATLYSGASTTVTNDFRGPILNGGSATCNGQNAGTVCVNDNLNVYSATDGLIYVQPGTTSNAAGVVMLNSSGTAVLSSAYYGSAHSDADYADKVVYAGFSKLVSIIRADDVAAGTAAMEWRDNTSATGVLLGDIDGAGRIRPLVYGSQTNCSDGAGAAACSAAPAGSFVVDNGTTSTVVSTTAVTANSQILIQFDAGLGTKLGVTCNTNATNPYVTARTAGTSFTVQAADPTGTDPACFSYLIIN